MKMKSRNVREDLNRELKKALPRWVLLIEELKKILREVEEFNS